MVRHRFLASLLVLLGFRGSRLLSVLFVTSWDGGGCVERIGLSPGCVDEAVAEPSSAQRTLSAIRPIAHSHRTPDTYAIYALGTAVGYGRVDWWSGSMV